MHYINYMDDSFLECLYLRERENRNVLSFDLKREVDKIERMEEGSSFHVRGAYIEKSFELGR